jgi:hypothetical protein
MTKVPAKTVKHIINATFPDYRKRSVYIKERDSIALYGLNWEGGSKSEYRACTINGKPLQNAVDMSFHAPWNNPYEGATIPIPEGYVVVEGGYFCGKKATLSITVNPKSIKLLTG